MSTDDGIWPKFRYVSTNVPMTSGEQFEAVHNILEEMKARFVYVSDLNGLDLALIIGGFGYEFVKTPTVN